MKKTLLAVALSSVAVIGMMNVANASDGTIHFTGNITDQTCTVDSASKDLTVALGNVAASSFTAAGDKSSPTKFELKLTDCPESVASVAVKYDGVADSINSSLLKLDDATDMATNVGIEISDVNGTAVPVATASMDYPVDATSGSANLDFSARYVSTAAAVTTGPANSTSQFTLNYK
ncbi:fimbrial protein [Lelliottia nimipressuralis]|uniref:Type 1 fimbrial protein n=1 Tax=Lelliottia nimipressuralis TaxID=69220 RepID=A0ABD4KI08_9ENTR|nr:fimbrial protein [Lelliottia nimipressuralis]MBF4180645.1 type 1 fimbrial protein [Lelliottia nimipressuralis]